MSVFKHGTATLPEGSELVAVGWIERPPFATGNTPQACIDALASSFPHSIQSDGTRGIHPCMVCGAEQPNVPWKGRILHLWGHGHYLVRLGTTVYMAPELILHYILSHNYRPPDPFIEATVHGTFLREDDLNIVWEPRWENRVTVAPTGSSDTATSQ